MENEKKKEKTENGINLKEFIKDLIVREFERSLEHKKDVEAKAASYMVAVTLILTILTTFMVEIKKIEICNWFLILFLIFYIILFVLGILLLFIFAYMLKPRDITYFLIRELINLLNTEKKTENEKTEELLTDCERFEQINRNTVQKLDKLNSIVSACVPFLIVGCGIETVAFIVAIIISLGGLK